MFVFGLQVSLGLAGGTNGIGSEGEGGKATIKEEANQSGSRSKSIDDASHE